MPVSDVLDLLAVKELEAEEINKRSGKKKNQPTATKLVKRRRKEQ